MRDPRGELSSLLQACGLFAALSPPLWPRLVALADHISLGHGEALLREGETNDHLYVLVSGSLAVSVGGDRVARLERQGDLVGEMSVLTRQPCSATVTAERDCRLVAIPAFSGADPDLQHSLYRLFATALSEKLMVTNEKARRFERLTEELTQASRALSQANLDLERKVEARTADLVSKTQQLETQNAELSATARKVEELYVNKDKTLDRLAELGRADLIPLRDALREVQVAGALGELTDQVAHKVDHLLASLEPLMRLHQSEVAMRDKRVLLAESDRKLQRVAKIALLGTGVQLDIPTDLDEGLRLCAANRYDVVCIDVEHIGCAQVAREANPGASVVFLTTEGPAAYLGHLRAHPAISNIVSCSADDRVASVKSILTTVSKLINHDLFGLEKYLLWGVEVEERTIRRSGERAARIAEMSAQLATLGVRPRVIERAAQAAEEMLMNALYDAPVDADRRPRFNHLPRTVAVELPAGEAAVLRWACDGVMLAVSIEDPYGALTRATILDYLDSCYGGRAGSLNAPGRKGGAGRGLYMITELSDLVIFNVQDRVRTEVIALFGVAEATSAGGASLQFFMLGDGGR